MAPKNRKPKPKPTRAEVAKALYDWSARINSTLAALENAWWAAREDLKGGGSPFAGLLNPSDVEDVRQSVANARCCSMCFWPGNPLGLELPTPAAILKGGVL
jgi:hypothetical protein